MTDQIPITSGPKMKSMERPVEHLKKLRVGENLLMPAVPGKSLVAVIKWEEFLVTAITQTQQAGAALAKQYEDLQHLFNAQHDDLNAALTLLVKLDETGDPVMVLPDVKEYLDKLRKEGKIAANDEPEGHMNGA